MMNQPIKNFVYIFTLALIHFGLHIQFSVAQTNNQAFKQGVEVYKANDFITAITHFTNSILANYPLQEEAHMYRGNAHFHLGNFEAAQQDYSKVIELNPDNASIYNNRALCLVNLQQYQAAIDDYYTAIHLDSDYANAFNNLANALCKQQQFAEAVQHYDQAIYLNPNNASFYNNRGVAKDDLGQYKDAIRDYNKALTINENYAEAYNNRGYAKHKLGQYEAAMSDYDKAISLNYSYETAIENKKLSWAKLNNFPLSNSRIATFQAEDYVTYVEPLSEENELPTKAGAASPYPNPKKQEGKKIQANFQQKTSISSPTLVEEKQIGSPPEVSIPAYPASKKQVDAQIEGTSNRYDLIWIQPNPDELLNGLYQSPDSVIEVKLKVLTSNNIHKENFNIFVNNQTTKFNEVRLHKNKKNHSYTFTARLPLEDGHNFINARLKNNQKFQKSDVLQISYLPAKPNLYVLAVGTHTNLKYTVKDADDFANLFIDQGDDLNAGLFNQVNVLKLLGREATANKIVNEIEQIKILHETQNLMNKDLLVLHLSSHGFVHNNKFYLQGSDYEPGKIRSTAVDYEEVLDILSEIPCKKLVFIDACHSGGADTKTDLRQIGYEIRKLNHTRAGITTIVSSSENEFSYEDRAWQNGAFTKAIKEALQYGVADTNNDRIVTINELYEYIRTKVPRLVQLRKGKTQTPQMLHDDLGNVAFYLVKN